MVDADQGCAVLSARHWYWQINALKSAQDADTSADVMTLKLHTHDKKIYVCSLEAF